MYAPFAGFRSSAWLALVAAALVLAGCGGDQQQFARVGAAKDAGPTEQTTMSAPGRSCDVVEVDGDVVIEHEQDFTARYRMGAPYDKTVMLFGGEPVTDANALSNAYIFALDKQDALMLAQQYDDFYLCSSPGGMEASKFIVALDLVPASCQVYEQLVAALKLYDRNLAIGGDRTSLRFEGAPLQLESVVDDASGVDVTDQVHDQTFHLVTSVQQLTGESVVAFGTMQ